MLSDEMPGTAFGPSGKGLVGAVGIEPTTFGLKGRCSTTELRPWSAIVRLYRLHADAATVNGIVLERKNRGIQTSAFARGRLRFHS